MAYLITHFYPGGTEAQYKVVVDAAHPGGKLPQGQVYHAAGPADGGWLIAAVWDSQESFDTFLRDTLMPTLQSLEGGFSGPPEQRSADVTNLMTA